MTAMGHGLSWLVQMHTRAVRKARVMINPQLRMWLLLGEGKWVGDRKEHTGR